MPQASRRSALPASPWHKVSWRLGPAPRRAAPGGGPRHREVLGTALSPGTGGHGTTSGCSRLHGEQSGRLQRKRGLNTLACGFWCCPVVRSLRRPGLRHVAQRGAHPMGWGAGTRHHPSGSACRPPPGSPGSSSRPEPSPGLSQRQAVAEAVWAGLDGSQWQLWDLPQGSALGGCGC